MIRILLVEDDPTFGSFLRTELAQQAGEAEVRHMEARDPALRALVDEVWDLLICDLKIPAEAGGLDGAEEHGLAVIGEAQQVSPGMPIIVLSAFNTLDIVQRLLRTARQEQIYGRTAEEPMVTSFQKSELDSCLVAVGHHATELLRLGQIEVTGAESVAERRVFRVFASSHGGDRVRVATIGGGLSTARVMRAEVFRAHAQIAKVLARVTKTTEAEREIAAYNRFIAPMLPVGLFTTRMPDTVRVGKTIGIFYTLVGSGDETLFDKLRSDASAAATLVAQLEQGTRAWATAGTVVSTTVGEVRRTLIADDDLIEIAELADKCGRGAVEGRTIQVRWCPQHNDLHGANILVENGRPVLIDYADIREVPSALDPVTLELSVFFHPAGLGASEATRDAVLAGNWWSGVTEGPLAQFIEQCRNWASAVAAGDRERLACAYAYAVRQLKYPNSDTDLAVAIASTAVRELLATF